MKLPLSVRQYLFLHIGGGEDYAAQCAKSRDLFKIIQADFNSATLEKNILYYIYYQSYNLNKNMAFIGSDKKCTFRTVLKHTFLDIIKKLYAKAGIRDDE